MTHVGREYISANEAGVRISNSLGFHGAYFLADNRRGKHEYLIPYRTDGRRVYYDSQDIDRFIQSRKSVGSKSPASKICNVETSFDVWLMGIEVSTDGRKVIEIVRGAGSEFLELSDARDLAKQLLELSKEAEGVAA